MTNVAMLRQEPAAAPPALTGVCRAEVAKVRGGVIDVRLASGETLEATSALAFSYEAALGDSVLVIRGDDGNYILGVIASTGRATLAFPGDLEVRAVGGVLRMGGDQGVVIDGPDVELRAGKLRVLAGAVVQRFDSLAQRIREVWSVRAGQEHKVIEGTSYAQSKSAHILTEENVTLNGKEIHLG